MSILAEIIKKQEEDFYLRNTSYLVHIPAPVFREELTQLYNHADLSSRALATLLNAIYTNGKPTFFLSIRTLSALFEGDKNLNYGSRKGIKTTQYREAAAELLNFLKESQSFKVMAESSKEHKTPACVALVNQKTLLSMGDGMMMKLASNWHEMAMKQLWNMRKCYEITEQSQKSLHVKVKVKDKDKQEIINLPNKLIPLRSEDEEIEIDLSFDSNPILNNIFLPPSIRIVADTIPNAQNHTPIASKQDTPHTDIPKPNASAEAILAKWKPIKVDHKDLDNKVSELFATLKYYSVTKDELSTKKIIKAMFGAAPSKKINWLVEKATQAIDEQRELAYAPEIELQQAALEEPTVQEKKGQLGRKNFHTDEAYALWHDAFTNGREIHNLQGSIVEYYENRAYANSFATIKN